jgi:apolipoprotein N-acyltransferase
MNAAAIRGRLAGAGDFVRGLSPRGRVLFAFIAGAMSATAFAPLEFFPALLLGYAALVLLIDGAGKVRTAALLGWAFSFGQFLIGLHWIGYAFLVDPSAHLWQMPFALLFLTAGLGLFGALAGAAAGYFWRRGAARLLVFAVAFALSEWLRGHVFTGFPWNLPAYGWGASLAVLQSASILGAYGLSFLTILLGASLAQLFARPMRPIAPVTLAVLFAAMWVIGAVELEVTPQTDRPAVRLRLVQPDIPQDEKYKRQFVVRNWQRLLDLSNKPGNPGIIIWPEAAPPFALARVPRALDDIAALLGPHRLLVTGAERVAGTQDDHAFYNSVYMFGPDKSGKGGVTLHVYDKFHLVPFGEYVPFADLMHRIGITKLTAGETGFSAGDGPHVYELPGAPRVTPLICYEVIFPGAVTAKPRPAWFVNVTDDSWFGPWAGPRQHLLIAQVRAIEEALPIVRVANTGISAVIDPIGRVRAALPMNAMGVLDSGLPRTLPPSLYARLGDWIFLGLVLAAATAVFMLAHSPGARR